MLRSRSRSSLSQRLHDHRHRHQVQRKEQHEGRDSEVGEETKQEEGRGEENGRRKETGSGGREEGGGGGGKGVVTGSVLFEDVVACAGEEKRIAEPAVEIEGSMKTGVNVEQRRIDLLLDEGCGARMGETFGRRLQEAFHRVVVSHLAAVCCCLLLLLLCCCARGTTEE